MKINSSYLIIPMIAIIVGLLGRVLIKSCDAWTWYGTLQLPAITPPNWFIPVVWNVIFILTTISCLIVWNGFARNVQFYSIISLFGANALLNVMWSYLFFNRHLIGMALLDGIVLALVTFVLMALVSSRSKLAGVLLLPYALWNCFAVLLNYLIWMKN